MLGLATRLSTGGASLLTYVKDNLKLYLDFKSNKSDTLKFPCEGSTLFDGTNDYIDCGDDTSLDITSTITISSWVYLNQVDESCYIIGREDGAVRNYILFAHSDGKFYFQINISSSTKSVGSTTTYVANRWYHVSGTYDGSQQKLYVDGVLEDDDAETGSIDNGDASLVIGAAADNDKYFNGKIANVGLWSRALSAEEVQSVMRKNYSQLGSVEKTSLVSWWALDTETLSDNLATAWTNADADAETLTTSGANITSLVNSSGHANVNLNAFATQYRVYKVSYDYTLVSGTHPKLFSATGNSQDGNVPTSSTFASLGSSWYYTADTGTSFAIWSSSTFSITVDNFSVKAVISADSHGSNTGYYSAPKSSAVSSHNSATTTTSVYGGNAPVLPRAVDVAKEGQADAIGNGSASFNGSSDYILVNDSSDLGFADGQAFSVALWFKTTSSGNMYLLDNRGGGSTTEGFAVVLDASATNYLGYIADGGNSATVTNTINYNDGNWHHLAFTWDGTDTITSYIDGSSVGTATQALGEVDGTDLYIGKYSANNSNYFNGNISQVGVWAGALTQAQIQSVMESTSYAKIPADVKSTLGSEELPSGDFKSNTGLTISQGSSGTLTHDTTAGTITATDDVQDGKIYWSGIIEDGKLYKATFVVDSCEGGRFRAIWGWTGNNFYPEVTSEQKTYVDYFVGGSSYAQFAIQFDTGDPCNFVLSNVSVKEVTNDIVAFYPLDADNSANGVTNDATTGEVLGSNTFGGLNQFQPKVVDRESVSVSGDEIILTIPSANDAGMHTGNFTNLGLSTSLGYAVGDLVKLQFEAKIVTNGSGYGETVRWYDSNGYVFPATNISLTSEYQTFTFINEITNLSYSIPSFLRMGNRTGTDVYNLKNFSVQKITSNTGVLK